MFFWKETATTGTYTYRHTLSLHDALPICDEGNRPSTTLESLSSLKPVFKDGQWIKQGQHITAGNASQLSDGAAVTVLMSGEQAKRRGLKPQIGRAHV